jgi:hypothetical protein
MRHGQTKPVVSEVPESLPRLWLRNWGLGVYQIDLRFPQSSWGLLSSILWIMQSVALTTLFLFLRMRIALADFPLLGKIGKAGVERLHRIIPR